MTPMTTTSPCHSALAMSEPMQAALRLLHEASEAERHRVCERHGFACQIANLLARGATETALRELVFGKFAEHIIETTGSRSRRRTFADASNNRFSARSNFALTAAGLALAAKVVRTSTSRGTSPTVERDSLPHFDRMCRKLVLGSLLIKQFRQPSDVQQLILGAFEEESWPARIDDPLPPVRGIDPKKRLSDAIYRLNCRQIHPLITFAGDGTGKGVNWRERSGIATEGASRK